MIPSLQQIFIVAVIFVLLFKAKDIPRLLGEFGSGVSAFKKNLNS